MRRNSGASGQQPTSGVAPSPETIFGNGRILDSRTPNPPHVRSSASSLDLIAISEDEKELGHAKPEAHLSPLAYLKPLSKVQSRTSMPEIISAGADNRKPNSSRSVGVPSPPERLTHGLFSEHLAAHTTTVVLTRPTRPTETAPDSTPNGSGCDMELSKDLTAQHIDILLGAAPILFDLSFSRHQIASREKGENDEQSEENSLWWYRPIFEVCAKADIRRTLSALLHEQGPPSPVAGGWTAGLYPRQPGARIGRSDWRMHSDLVRLIVGWAVIWLDDTNLQWDGYRSILKRASFPVKDHDAL